MIALVLSSAMVLSLAACGGGGKTDSKKASSGEKDEEQYINTYMVSEPTTLDPSLRSDTYSSEILISTMEGLIRIEERDGEYKIMPGDAETWEKSDDGKE